MGSHLFCCQTRIRRSACACCNDCCFAALGNRTPSLSPSKQSLVGTPINGFESSNLPKNKRPPKREVFRFVAKLGFEPRQTEPESVVLPLHHLAIPKGN